MTKILERAGIRCEEGTFLISRYLMDTVQSYLKACPARTVLDALANSEILAAREAFDSRPAPEPVR